jgi:hypothetical protein
MGLFDKVRDAELYERGSYLPAPGDFLLKVQRAKTIETRKEGMAAVVEFVVETSTRDDVEKGKRADLFCLKKSDYFARDLLELLVALRGLVPGKRDNPKIKEWQETGKAQKLLEEMFDEDVQPATDMLVRCETVLHTTKENKKDISLMHFRPFYESPEDAAKEWRPKGTVNKANAGAMPPPPGAQLSPDGSLWWDGAAWRPVPKAAPPPPPPTVAAAPPPPPPNPRAGWQRSPDGLYLLNPGTNVWESAQ